jgi:hypothetical protein
MAATTKFRQGQLHDPDPKKKVTRFNNYDTSPVPLLQNAYINNEDLDALGKPEEITVVVLPGRVKVKSVTLS